MHNYSMSGEKLTIGARRRKKSKSESEYLNPPAGKNRLGSMMNEITSDCLDTPSGRSLRGSTSQPDISDVFIETPLGLGSSTRLASGLIFPNWESIDQDITDLEGLSEKVGPESIDVKLICDRLMTRLIQINRKFQLNGQFGETLEVDQRKERLYRIRKTKENRPIRYKDDDDNEDYITTVVKDVNPLITLLNDKICQNVQNFCSAGGYEQLANAEHQTVQLSRKRGAYYEQSSDAREHQGFSYSHTEGGLDGRAQLPHTAGDLDVRV